MSEKIIIEIESPYTDGVEQVEGLVGMATHWIKQLKYYQKTNDTEKIRLDIQGYEELVKANDEENVSKFLRLKESTRERNMKCTNLDIVNFMKRKGIWNEAMDLNA